MDSESSPLAFSLSKFSQMLDNVQDLVDSIVDSLWKSPMNDEALLGVA